jgi:hypothetical protein
LANAVVFSVLKALFLRPLDMLQAQSLETIEHGKEKSLVLSYPDYLDLRDRNRSVEGFAAYKRSGGTGHGRQSVPARLSTR